MKVYPLTQAAVHLVCGNLWEEGSSILLKACLLELSIIHERDASDLSKCQEPCRSFSEVKSEESSCCSEACF